MSRKIDERRKSSDNVSEAAQGTRWSADRMRKSEQTRRRLLEALEKLLRTQSLHEVSVNDVAAAAGMRRTGFYFYFPSKEVAVATLLDELYNESFAGAALFMARTADRETALREAFAQLWELWKQHRSLVIAVLDARGNDRDAAEIWQRWLDRFISPVAQVITADRAAGLAPEGPDPDRLLTLLLSMNERSLERMLRARSSQSEVDRELDAIATVWVRTIYGRTENR
jgi:TetR/AcrR family transcriptional regulator, ethionamide resistance regulator